MDFNYPDHLEHTNPREVKQRLADLGLGLNGFAMRYYSEPGFKIGALTNPDPTWRGKAMDITRRGIDALADGRKPDDAMAGPGWLRLFL